MRDEANKDGSLFVSCLRATELVSKALERELTSRERFAMRFHMLICAWCRRYRKQVAVIRAAVRHKAVTDERSGAVLPPDAKERIRRALGG